MEIRHLRCFVAVAEERHFGRAAARLRLSPSPVSRTVAELEHELSVPLFVREHHAVRLTEAGTALLPSARRMLADWASFVDAGRRLGRDEQRPRVRLGAPSLSSSVVVDHVLAVLDGARPDVPVDVEFGASSELLAALVEGHLDLTVAHLPVDPTVFGSMPLARYALSVVVASSDGLAAAASASVSDLAGRRVLLVDADVQPTTMERVGRWVASAGASIEAVPGGDLVRIAQLVRHGRGITLASATGIGAQIFAQPGLAVVPFAGPGPTVELGLVWARSVEDGPLIADVRAGLTNLLSDGLLTA